MCHANLGPFAFGSNVNFIVGNNGSEFLFTLYPSHYYKTATSVTSRHSYLNNMVLFALVALSSLNFNTDVKQLLNASLIANQQTLLSKLNMSTLTTQGYLITGLSFV